MILFLSGSNLQLPSACNSPLPHHGRRQARHFGRTRRTAIFSTVTTTVPFQYLMHLLTIPVCVGDTETRFIFDTGIDGFLSLQYFRSTPVTVDYPARVLVLEDEQSLARRAESGFPVSVQIEDDGPSTDVHLAMRLPGGRVISAEVDASRLTHQSRANSSIPVDPPGTLHPPSTEHLSTHWPL